MRVLPKVRDKCRAGRDEHRQGRSGKQERQGGTPLVNRERSRGESSRPPASHARYRKQSQEAGFPQWKPPRGPEDEQPEKDHDG